MVQLLYISIVTSSITFPLIHRLHTRGNRFRHYGSIFSCLGDHDDATDPEAADEEAPICDSPIPSRTKSRILIPSQPNKSAFVFNTY
ncbi:hypothetical protein NLI96_g1720 [Meripilus lineatus]|uniref:Uncharacterized protein n=1 Tax=Meripilus lineatus TaxID=2056292 RepID=A0AAD5YI50_9APHY|nr:hypothetical protein NLI96_g1720 [Physisporinus lineatus]